jgi:hypothetical protein
LFVHDLLPPTGLRETALVVLSAGCCCANV